MILEFDDPLAVVQPPPAPKGMQMRPYQTECIGAVLNGWVEYKRQLAVLATGCHAKGTLIMLADGRTKLVEDVVVGDRLMGWDNTPRTVLRLARGRQEMARIVPVKGEPFVVNLDHILTLVRTQRSSELKYPSHRSAVVDVSVRDWLGWSRTGKHLHKLLRQGIELHPVAHTISPYFIGAFLGDGHCKQYRSCRWMTTIPVMVTTGDQEIIRACEAEAERWACGVRTAPNSENSVNVFLGASKPRGRGHRNPLSQELVRLGIAVDGSVKFIPDAYKFTDTGTRLEVLAGLLDTDGHLAHGIFDYISQSKRLAEDVVWLSRSLGLAAYMKPCEKRDQHGNGGTYYRVCISGHVDMIPTRIPRKQAKPRLQKKDVLRTGFSVELLPADDYYGFSIEGDGRFLLGDFTVTHNCGKTIVFSELARIEATNGGKVLILAHTDELIEQARDKFTKLSGLRTAKEKADEYAGRWDKVVVGSVQTLCRDARLKSFTPRHFSLIIVDEAHHALAASYQKILTYFDTRILGVTATADRSDKKALGDFFEHIAYEYGMLAACRDGWLVRPVVQTVPLNIDLRSVHKRGGDFAADEVAHAIEPFLVEIAAAIKLHAAREKTVVFMPSIDTAKKMAEACAAQGFNASWVSGQCPDRKEKLAAYEKAGPGSVIANAMLLCLDLETEILTDSGWVSHHEMTPDHRVANWNTDGTVFFEKPIEIVHRDREPTERMVGSVEKSNYSICVTEGHRMLHWTGVQWVKRAAREFTGRVLKIPVCGVAQPSRIDVEQEPYRRSKGRLNKTAYNLRKRGYNLAESFVEAKRRMDVRKALRRLAPSELSVDQCRLIGFWIGDGSRCKLQSGGVEYTLCQAKVYPHIVEWVDRVVAATGYSAIRREKPGATECCSDYFVWSLCRGTGSGVQERKGLYEIEPYLQKHGTELFWGLNSEQFDALVEGYWYADGHHGQAEFAPESLFFSDTKKQWLDMLQAIGSVRGYFTRMRMVFAGNERHNPQWGLRMKKGVQFATVPIGPAADVDAVWCVRTTSKNIITRRRGTVAVMGNTEGWDVPDVSCVICLRPTQVRALYQQMVGRGTRPHPSIVAALSRAATAAERNAIIKASVKPRLLLLDFLWLYEKHSLVKPASLVAKTEEEAERITKMGDGDLVSEQEQAEHDLLKKLEDEVRKNSRKKAGLIDPLSFAVEAGDTDLASYEPETQRDAQPPTEKQLAFIARHGIDATLVTSKGQASKIIGKVMQRLDGGLCSIRQLNFLHKLGIDASSLTREEASQAIATRLASRKSGHAQRPDTAAL